MNLPWKIPLAALRSDVLHLDQYFGLWAVEEVRFYQILSTVERMDLTEHIKSASVDASVHQEEITLTVPGETEGAPPVEQKISLITIRGVMTKYGSSLSRAGSSVRIRKAVREARRSADIKGILLHMDTPGGSTAGLSDLSDEVMLAAREKPVYAFAEDLVASAGYHVASQATKIYANNRDAQLGAIGTWIGLYDFSRAAENEGIKAIVVKAGEMKGLGFPGTEITEAQREHLQGIVDATQKGFTEAVARGRKMDEEEVPANGRIYMAAEALSLGLIDGIASFEETLAMLSGEISARENQGDAPDDTNKSVTASGSKNTPIMDEPKSVTTTLEETTLTVEPDETEALRAELALLKAERERDAATIAKNAEEIAAAARRERALRFEKKAHALRRKIGPAGEQAGRFASLMEHLHESAEAQAEFEALLGALPDAYTEDVIVTEETVAEEAKVGPAGHYTDPEQQALHGEIATLAQKEGISFNQAVTRYAQRAQSGA